MRFCSLSLSLLTVLSLPAATPLKPEAPLVAQAEAFYRSKSPAMPVTVADVLKLQEGDANLALGALTGRWMADRLAQGKIPDEHSLSRMLEGFSWDEAGVAQLHGAGLDTGVLRLLADARPLGLAPEAQERLGKAGVNSRVVTALARQPMGTLPPMRSMADLAKAAMVSDPIMGSPAFKSQLDDQRKKIEQGMAKQFQGSSFKREIWDRVLETWRSRIQVGSDARNVLAPSGSEIVDAPPPEAPSPMAGMFGAAQAGNDLFLKSAPVGAALAVGDVAAVLRGRTTALIRAKEPKDAYVFRLEDATVFTTRRKPTELALVRLQDGGEGAPTARLSKGVYFGREFQPADEPVAVDIAQEGETWAIRPKSRLAPGSYAFLLGGQSLLFLPFVVR